MTKYLYRSIDGEFEAELEVPKGYDAPSAMKVPNGVGKWILYRRVGAEDEPSAVHLLDQLDGKDYEKDHGIADEVLLRWVPEDIADAYRRLRERAGNWPTA